MIHHTVHTYRQVMCGTMVVGSLVREHSPDELDRILVPEGQDPSP